MPEFDSGAIDKVTDARGEYVLSQREDSDGVNRLSPSPQEIKMQKYLHMSKKSTTFAAPNMCAYGYINYSASV